MSSMSTFVYSIIVPVYKVEQYIDKCIQSVLCQTYANFELILVDDGSPDNSPMICDAYAQADKRIKVLHKTNGGLSDARNHGLDNATGDYVMFLDSDDWWDSKDALNRINHQIESSGCDMLIFGLKKCLSTTDVYYDEVKPRLNLKCNITDCIIDGWYRASACDKVIKRSLIERCSLRFVKGQLSEDIEWCTKLIANVETVSLLPESIYVYRQNPASISHNVKRKNISDILDVISRYAKDGESLTDPIQNFMALQYVLLIATSTRVDDSDISDLLKKMKGYWYLWRYNHHPRVKTLSKFRFMGFTLFKSLLNVYMNRRKG